MWALCSELCSTSIDITFTYKRRIHDKFQQPGSKVEKGEELGLFQFGGSSIIVAFQHGRIKFDDDLLKNSKHCVQVSVEVGMGLGRATQPSSSRLD
jgi:phosphatidylserine decarboxylase